MKVLHIESGKHLYGGAKQVTYLIKGLDKKGVDNILVCPKDSEIAKKCFNSCNVIDIPMKGDIDFHMVWRLKKIIMQYKPNIIHIHSRRGADTMGAIAAKITHTPAIISRRVDNKEPRWLAHIKYNLFEHIITISCGIRDVLLKEGVPPNRITCIHSAIDITEYEQKCDKSSFLKEFNISDNAITIGVIAQLIKRKGHELLLNILPSLIDKYPNISVLFFGQGPLKEKLLKSITEKKLDKVVKLTGFIDNLHKWIGCLDIVVHPALYEGLGISLLQASAASVPIVASPFGGIPEVVHDGINGFLVDPNDSINFQNRIERLIQDKTLRQKMGQNGNILVKKHFSIETMVEGNLKIYKEILS